MQTQKHYRKTKATLDLDAKDINLALNSILHSISVGRMLKKIYQARFAGAPKAFRRWIADHIDCSTQTVGRYLCLAEHAATLEGMGLTDLIDAYHLLGINGSIPVNDPIWGITDERCKE